MYKSLKHFVRLGTLSLALCGAFGCQDTINTTRNTNPAMTPDNVDTSKFATDSFCRDRLALVSCRRAMTPGDVLMVQAEVRSERYGFWAETWSTIRNANPYHVLYRFDWFDENGMKVSTAADTWQEVIFIPGETKFLQGVAPNSRCKDFLLSVKEKRVN